MFYLFCSKRWDLFEIYFVYSVQSPTDSLQYLLHICWTTHQSKLSPIRAVCVCTVVSPLRRRDTTTACEPSPLTRDGSMFFGHRRAWISHPRDAIYKIYKIYNIYIYNIQNMNYGNLIYNEVKKDSLFFGSKTLYFHFLLYIKFP